MKRKTGFTGTQAGMTPVQKEAFCAFVDGLEISIFAHGDCIGSDAQAHKEVMRLHPNCWMEIHPPSKSIKRAFCKIHPGSGLIHKPMDYLERNHEIVRRSDILIATPEEIEEQLRSGTWATVRRARKLSKPVVIIFPTGEIKLEKP